MEFRVHPAARQQVERAVEQASETVGQLLAKAWNAAYGMGPQPDVAWTAAFAATEAALRPIISPSAPNATLGRLISDYEAKPSRWESSITDARPTFDPTKHERLDGTETVMQMARTICYGQKARHGQDGPANGVDEARAAVHLAITIAMACQEGTFRQAAA